ncbi:metallophosphoesterase [Streptomyces sp. NPDC051940]|uniref:metallophosphoesterase n=1 Tax=Streptomyces sp. NPDC051940 TaxID=3155675 RepID=UPI0034299FB9
MNPLVIVVIGVIVSLVALVHWYLWRRLVRDTTTPGSRTRRVLTVVLIALPVTTFAGLATERAGANFTLQRVLAWPGMLWLATLLYLSLALFAGELVRPLLRRFLERRAARRAADEAVTGAVADPGREAAVAALAQKVAVGDREGAAGSGGGLLPDEPDAPAPESAAPEPADLSRRLFVARTVAVGATAAAVGTVGYGAYGVLGRAPKVKRVTVPLAKLPRAAHGYRIAVVSDIHLGPVLGRHHTERIVATINRTNPDLIAVVGDLVDGTVEHLGPAAEPLRGLRARDGSFFVTGNHEYFSGAAEWVDHVRELGIHPLENARTELAGFDLAGVNDVAGEDEGDGPDFEKALGDRDTSRAVVLMAHQPVVIHDAVDHGVDLQLSGHTHGGQLWPGNYVAALANPTVAGLERYGDTQLYVTRGAGAWGPPVRVGAESDITVVELASRQA